MSRGVSEKTKKLTMSAVLAAMGTVLLMIGAFIEALALSMAALASFFCIFSVIEMGKGYPWMIYAVTGILSVVLMPQNLGGWVYILFFGYYPILKEKIEKKNKLFSWIFKFLIFNAAVTLYAVICFFFMFGEIEALLGEFAALLGGMDTGALLIAIIYFVLNFVFVIYDLALTQLITLYFRKLRKKFRFLK